MPEGTGLAEKLLDVRGDGFHPPEKDRYNMASSATQHQPFPWVPHSPPHHPGALLVGVHIFGEIQMDEAGMASMDQGSKELPGWGGEPC